MQSGRSSNGQKGVLGRVRRVQPRRRWMQARKRHIVARTGKSSEMERIVPTWRREEKKFRSDVTKKRPTEKGRKRSKREVEPSRGRSPRRSSGVDSPVDRARADQKKYNHPFGKISVLAGRMALRIAVSRPSQIPN